MAEGFLDFTAGAVLTAAQVDDYLMRQTVMRFASAAARDTALSAVLVEGLVAFLKDTDTITMYTGSAWASVGQIGSWATYTPTMFQQDGTGQTLTVTKARYTRSGRLVAGDSHLVVTAAGSATNGEYIVVSMPITPQDTASNPGAVIGQGFIIDVSAGTRYPVFVLNTIGGFRFWRTDAIATSWVGVDPGFALAAGDEVIFSYEYEGT